MTTYYYFIILVETRRAEAFAENFGGQQAVAAAATLRKPAEVGSSPRLFFLLYGFGHGPQLILHGTWPPVALL
ncbi:Uncharacterized protein TCM_000975 [Theobroma cacao]|uniref:Uncharacterized protein n=1 Tax=Theobroma cacao TaxID=3641 RepID=A0A061DJ26_THECC|nr:Uncharacterized protein TCM_000975 [Theobroma cacao]